MVPSEDHSQPDVKWVQAQEMHSQPQLDGAKRDAMGRGSGVHLSLSPALDCSNPTLPEGPHPLTPVLPPGSSLVLVGKGGPETEMGCKGSPAKRGHRAEARQYLENEGDPMGWEVEGQGSPSTCGTYLKEMAD